jgi:hypothetical protein
MRTYLGMTALLVLAVATPAVGTELDAQLSSVSATSTGDGILNISPGGLSAFAFAVMNIGSRYAEVTVTTVLPPSIDVPLSIPLACFTNQAGQCISNSSG